MPPSADQVSNVKNILQAYQNQVRTIVTRHKKTIKKAIEHIDRRKTDRLRKKLTKG